MKYLITSHWIIMVLIHSGVFAQTVYYVSPSGNNSNGGTSSEPFQTIQHCIDQWDGISQFICRCSGTFNEELVIAFGGPDSSQRNKLIAWDTDGDNDLADETFILDGQGTRNVAISTLQSAENPDNIEIAWMTIENYEPDGGCGDSETMSFINLTWGDDNENWWIHNNVMRNLGINCDWETDGSSYIAISPRNAPNMIIENNHISKVGGYIMRYANVPNMIFRNNTVEIASYGLKIWGDRNDSIQIVNNSFVCDGNGDNTGLPGACKTQIAVAFTNDVQYSLIKGNTFDDCNNGSIVCGSSDIEKGVRDVAYNIIEGNRINRSSATCNQYSTDIAIGGCGFPSDANGDSLSVHDIIVRNNILSYSGPTTYPGGGINIRSGHLHDHVNNFEIYNNTIYGYRYGFRLTRCFDSGSNTVFPYQLNGITIRNNILSKIGDASVHPWATFDIPSPRNWDSDYNVFDGSGADQFYFNGNVLTLEQWQDSTGNDINSSLCSPQFVDPDNQDFNLEPSDNCALDQGIALTGFTNDIDGNTRPGGSTWDIGALEFQTPDAVVNIQAGLTDMKISYMGNRMGHGFLKLNITESGYHSISTFDMQGRKVQSLLGQDLDLGTYKILFPTNTLPPGIFIVVLKSQTATSIVKVVIH